MKMLETVYFFIPNLKQLLSLLSQTAINQTMHVYWVFASTCMYLYFTKTDRVYTLSTRI